MIRRLIIPTILIFWGQISIGQSYYFRQYQVESGLSNNAVISSVQDDQGFLWFGTKDGLNRFDGYSFKIFRHDPDKPGSLGSNFIHSLFLDKNKSLWVGTDKGLYKYDAKTESFHLLPTPFIEQITDIQMDKAGCLWFISNFHLFRFDEARHRLTHFPINRYFEATSICSQDDGSIWVSTSSGTLEWYQPETVSFKSFDLFSHSPKTVSLWIEQLYGTRDGKILAGTSNQGAKLFDPSTGLYQDILTYNPDGTEIFARNFVQTGENECWIGTETGVFIYDMKTGNYQNLRKNYENPYSLSDNAVYTFCKDREGGIWAGTYFGGLNYFSPQSLRFQKYFPLQEKNSLSGNVVREMLQDAEGNLWIGTEDAGLNQMNRSTGLFRSFLPDGKKGSISYSNIHGLLLVGNELWIGTFEHGLDVMDTRTGKVIRHYAKGPGEHDLKSNFIYSLYQSDQGEIMLATTIGAYYYNKKTDDFSALPGIPFYNWYSAIFKDENGVIWAATMSNGVHFYDTKSGKAGSYRYDSRNKNSLPSDRVNSIFRDSFGNLWFATEGGLCRFDAQTNSFKKYGTADGFPSDFILSVLEDDDHNLWVGTSRGLVCFDPRNSHLTVFTSVNGLLNNQFNFGSAYKSREGTMYFGSVKGMISFHPSEFRKGEYSAPVLFTGFQVNNRDLPISEKGSPLNKAITHTEKIKLPHDQSTFSIDFASLSFSAPEMSEYAYKMEGLDHDWIYLKTNRKVYFTNLSPGQYTFRVRAANHNSAWTRGESSLSILITPPWWKSRPAYLLYVITLLLLIFYFVREYHLRIRNRNLQKMKQLEIAKEKELYEAKMDFFTNVAHEIKTPLTLIKGPLERVIRLKGDSPELKDSLRIMERNTGRLVELTNQLLDFRQSEIRGFSLNFTRENISDLVEETFLGFRLLADQKALKFLLNLPPSPVFAFIDPEAFLKILTNLLSNAVKYARQYVEITLLPLQEGVKEFTVEVKNDGYLIPYAMKEKIFEPFFRLEENKKQKGTGIGLALSRSLAELHCGILDLKYPVNGMNIFFVKLPLKQDAELKNHSGKQEDPKE